MGFEKEGANKTVGTLIKQLQRYMSACFQDRAPLLAVERQINSLMLPRLEELAAEDYKYGGTHSIVKGQSHGQPVLQLDGFKFSNYKAAFPSILIEQRFIKLGLYNRNQEGDKMMEMIKDFCEMDTKDFADKHFKLPPFEEADRFIKKIGENIDESVGGNYKCSELSIPYEEGSIDLLHPNLLGYTCLFLADNARNYPNHAENGTLYFDKYPMQYLGLEIFAERDGNGVHEMKNITLLGVVKGADAFLTYELLPDISKSVLQEFCKSFNDRIDERRKANSMYLRSFYKKGDNNYER